MLLSIAFWRLLIGEAMHGIYLEGRVMIYVTAVIERLQTEKQEVENGVDVENPFLSAFRQFQNIDKLARDILIELVDQIKVYEGGSIRIVFCFADELRRVKEYIEVDTHNEAV